LIRLRSAGIVLILCGAFVLYQVLHGRLASAQPSSSPSSGGGGGGGGGGGSSGNPDSGSHAALGSDGTVYTINKGYGDMTDSEKDDANRYAHTIGNVSG
jgi:hypothetical protein